MNSFFKNFFHNYQIASFLVIFDKVQVQLWIQIHNHEFRIRIKQKVSDPCESGSKTLF
jgi:hypothetical protein